MVTLDGKRERGARIEIEGPGRARVQPSTTCRAASPRSAPRPRSGATATSPGSRTSMRSAGWSKESLR